ncbi:hypothetical protein B0H14DRAFT_2626437 [Mycena olivaceomarginata]|nr:hypothetical protein B0H14DRAFT_2626437 [Mycena olivaceomarginata]
MGSQRPDKSKKGGGKRNRNESTEETTDVEPDTKRLHIRSESHESVATVDSQSAMGAKQGTPLTQSESALDWPDCVDPTQILLYSAREEDNGEDDEDGSEDNDNDEDEDGDEDEDEDDEEDEVVVETSKSKSKSSSEKEKECTKKVKERKAREEKERKAREEKERKAREENGALTCASSTAPDGASTSASNKVKGRRGGPPGLRFAN